MKGVVLAAGEGTRMGPLTYTRPKVMLPLANKPILEHLLIEASKAGITEFLLVVGYHDEQVRDYFGNGDKWGMNIGYSSQKKQLGTADAIKLVEGSVGDNFLLMNGDVIVMSQDIRKVINAKETTLGIMGVEDATGLGIVEVGEGKVVHIYEKTEKAQSHMANAGIYLLTPEVFSAISQTPKSIRGEYELTDSLQLMIDWGHRILYQEIGCWLNLSYHWDLLQANEYLLRGIDSQKLGEIEDGVTIKNAVYIGKGTVVKSGAYLVGPIVIGKNCEIGPNCCIRPSTSIGDGCHIGNAVEVKNSIIMKGSKIPHHNYVGDSIIGEECNLGAGTKIANLRLDKGDIRVAGMDTRRRKLGAIIGDRVETGINACINVGTIIGSKTHIGPGAIVTGVISPNTRIL